MRRREAGVTFIGWIVLLVPMAIVLYACIRLTPIYLNNFKVAKAVEAVASENGAQPTVSVATVRRDLDNRFDIEGISYPETKDIAVVREGEGWVIEASYEQVAPLFGSIQLLVSFDKREPIR
jgi:hypothetical protein